jgi:hypothetical protein
MRYLALLFFLPILATAGYWQQETNYEISVSLDDIKNEIAGTVTIEYINHSPDTLNQIFIHCWPNAYSSSKTPLAKQLLRDENTYLQLNDKTFRGGISALNFQIDDVDAPWSFVDDFGEIALIQLQKPLLPGSKVKIHTPFIVKIPKGLISRLGHLDDDFQITQWYPKPAVYDEEGWHPMPYLSQGEFFSEFGDYKVNITVPNNYMVAASGQLTEESLKNEAVFLQKRIKKTDAVFQTYPLHKDGRVYYYPQNENPASSNEPKTLSFEIEDVHDFAWFCSKNWLVQSQKVTLKKSKKTVETYTYFLPENMHVWKNALQMMENGLNHYSDYVGIYPYNSCTAVDGSITAGAGMEYPSITILTNPGNHFMFEETLVHEIGHNWFYGCLANNEREDPWMDEGMNSFLELKYFEEYHPEATITDMLGGLGVLAGFPEKKQRFYYEIAYALSASRNFDAPVDLPAAEYSSDNYPSIIYAKPAIILRHLEGYLGKEKMSLIFQKYFQEFNGKHVHEEDFWKIAAYYSEKDLSWASEDMFSTKKMDYAVTGASYNPNNNNLEILVKNKGEINAPFPVTTYLEGEVGKTYWFEGFSGSRVLNLGELRADYIVLDDNEETLDVNRNNNHYHIFRLLGGIEQPKVRFFTGIDRGNETEIFATPSLLYNANDGFKLGVVAYNSTLREKPFRFVTSPNFGFGSQHITGTHKIYYSTYYKKLIRKINWEATYRNETFPMQFDGMIEKYEGGQTFFFKKDNALSPWENTFKWRYTAVKTKVPGTPVHVNEYVTLSHLVEKNSTFHPLDWKTNVQFINGDVIKAWTALNLNWTVDKRKLQNIHLRIFGGAFLTDIQDEGFIHRFRLTEHNGQGAKFANEDELIYSGMTDYLMDEYFMARYNNNNSNWLTQQIGMNDGGFKTGINFGQSSNWMATTNLTIPTPVSWVSAFGDYGWIGGSEINTAYDYGLQFNMIEDYFYIYFPLGFSENIQNEYDIQGIDSFAERIRFRIEFDEIFKLIE